MALYIGLMSGTSMDGIDAALVELPGNKLIHGITKKYSETVSKALNDLNNEGYVNLAQLCQLNTLIGQEFASAVHELLALTKIDVHDIQAIGSHGQTICHDTRGTIPYTLQLGCAHTISTRTGIPVVADFRTRDIVNGGQGAPFAPLYHHELFSHYKLNLAIVNLGGIANVTFINPDQATNGWDIGPANCLIDAWIYKHQGQLFDKDGLWAEQGNIIEPLLEQLLSDPFFHQATPKSIGKEYFSLVWLEQYLKKEYQAVDVQATLVALTARSIAEALVHKTKIDTLYLCGGGTHNSQLRRILSQYIPQIPIKNVEDIGVSPDFLEAMMFAWLAEQRIQLKSTDLTAITGSRKPAILGALYPA